MENTTSGADIDGKHLETAIAAAAARSTIGTALIDGEGRIRQVSPGLAAILGVAIDELEGAPGSTLVDETTLADPGPSFLYERLVETSLGRRWIEVHGTTMNENASPGRRLVLIQVVEVTRRKAAEQVHQRLLDQLRALLADTRELVVVADAQGRVIYSSPSGEEPLRHTRELSVGRSVLDLVHADDIDDFAAALRRAREHPEQPIAVRCRIGDVTNTWRHVEGTVRSRLDDPSVAGIVIALRSDEPNRRFAARIAELEERQRVLVDESLTPMMLVVDDRVVFANQAAAELLGTHHFDDLLGCDLYELVEPDRRETTRNRIARELHSPTPGPPHPVDLIRGDGTHVPVTIRFQEVVLHQRRGFSLTLADVTEQDRHVSRLEKAASHDALTGLENRSGLAERIDRLIASLRPSELLAVLLLDLDGFKEVNDTGGHRTGDEVLQRVAQRMLGTVRPGDAVIRFGGDEFVVLARVESSDAATGVGRRLVDRLAGPFVIDGVPYRIGASAGLALSTDPTVSGDELLHRADSALYRAKAAGGAMMVIDQQAL